MKIYRDHINMFLSKLGYSELVQRLFEKMTFSLVDPLAKGRDGSSNCCTTNGVLDQLENHTVIHLEQGMGMGHMGDHVTLHRTSMYE